MKKETSEAKGHLERLGELSPEKQALLELLLQEGGGGPETFPLSFAQERLWFLHQLEPDSAAYNIAGAVRLQGRLDVSALERTLDEIVRRHESLRTTFSLADGQPVQVIAPAMSLPLPLVDLSAAPGRDAEVTRLSAEEARQPFDLAGGPLVRAKLLRVGEEEHILLFTMHHIVSDGWSMGVLVGEVAALYAAFSEGRPSPLPELPIQYADYAVWQREWLQGEALEAQLSYWRERLAGAPAALELPADYPRPPAQSHRGAEVGFRLGAAQAARLRGLAVSEGATLFMALVGCWQALLMRLSGSEDVPVGTPVAGRGRRELEGLVGVFINTLVLRTDLSGDPTLAETVRRAREVCLGAFQHQDMPFERLVEELRPERSLGHTPLFQVLFTLNAASGEAIRVGGLRLEPIPRALATEKFDLTMTVEETAGGGFEGTLSYSTDLFTEATARRIVAAYERVLEAAAADPSRKVWDVALLGEDERRRAVEVWNSTRRDYAREQTIHELFEARAALRPEAPALEAGGEVVTYAELNAWANRLARRLRAAGVGPESRVGLLAGRGWRTVAALLGVLKAGGAYVPLDPRLPARRIGFIMDDAEIDVLVTEQEHVGGLPPPNRVRRLVLLDAEWDELAGESAGPLAGGAGPQSLAYIIYTSGSTGQPKGVMIQHRSALNLLEGLKAAVYARHDGGPLRASLNAPLSFDASVQQLLLLLEGHTLVMTPEEVRADGEAMAEHLRRREIDVLDCTPSQLALLVAAGLLEEGRRKPGVFLVGGEALDAGMWRTLALARESKFFNVYGPTECTVDVTSALVTAEVERPRIGRPLANTQLYVLDRSGEPAPVGVTGEIYIGGEGLARGYLRRPGLTAERFVPDSFSGKPGARLYRTGDLARYAADGEVEYVGRVDQQVKVRGFRIELGEIEAALSRHDAVAEAVVVAAPDASGDARLVAYFTHAGEAPPAAAELRRHLLQTLPEYMTPSLFVPLAAMPLTRNGKVDRRALPEPTPLRDAADGARVAPRTPVEERLAEAWAALLGLDAVGVDENFFELGGHSLLATRAASRLRELFGVELPLRSIFEHPTIAGLAGVVERALREREGPAALPLARREPGGEPPPLSFAQERLWFLDQLEPGGAAYNIPGALRLSGPLDLAVLERALSEIARRHEVLRTTLTLEGGRPVQVIAPATPVSLPLVSLRALDEQEREAEVRRLAEEEARRPFDLAAGPLVRARMLALAADEHVLLFTMHHVVSDGWSRAILIEELAALYEAFAAGRPSPLAELPIQYADFAVWQREWLQGAVLDEQLSYWKQQLGGPVPALQLPTDHPRPASGVSKGDRLPLRIEPALLRSLTELSNREGATPFMTMLAAFYLLLMRYSGQEDVVVGSPIAGRNRAEVEPLIGFFVNTLALRTDLSGDPTFAELLGRVKEVALGAYAHQDLPFEKLVEELHPERRLGHTPLFQVMFILQNTPPSTPRLSGVRLSPVPVTTQTAKFDLTLELRQEEAGLVGEVEYSTELFERGTAERVARDYARILAEVVRRPTARLSEVELLDEPERRLVLEGWNETEAAYPSGSCLHELFEAQAARAPEATALVYGDERVSYGELNARANRLAHYLRRAGVGAETRVGVCLPRSPELVVALLGALKAGGAYVPLDPQYPRERLSFMAADAGISVLLTREELADRLPEHGGAAVLLDAERERIEAESAENPGRLATSENIAYVIYTSGSTGRPKGVLGSHRACVNRFEWMWRRDPFGPDEVCCQKTSLGFVDSVWEIFGPLLQGVPSVIVPDEVVKDPPRLVEFLARHEVTRIVLVPSLLRAILDAERGDELSRLRYWVSSGEALGAELVERFKQRDGGRRLINLYGSSEVCADATCYETPRELGRRSVPIGRPIANTQVFILDARLKPVPVGLPGEIYVGGAGLARGYHDRPGLTAERFIPHPYGKEPGARLYRTGDLGRHLPTGEVEYLGRADYQVKVRGYRIELGEVEAVLKEHPAVDGCVVVLREGASDGEPGSDARLVAYVAAGAEVPSAAELRGYVRERLPDYMTPSHFVTLGSLPLTPSGKIDRRALPAPDLSGAATSDGYVAPRTGVEELVAEVWAGVLGVGRVGALDNFFDAGGHSLLATQLLARLKEAFGVEVGLRAFFEAPTVEAVAALVEGAMREGGAGAASPIGRANREEPLPLSFAQERLWFLYQLDPDSPAYNILIPLRVRGALDTALMERSFAEVVRRHEIYRTTYHIVGGRPVQVVHPQVDVSWSAADLSETPEGEREAEARRLVVEEGRRPFDLERGPLWRVLLLRLREDEHVIVLTEHHIVHDGWTEGPLVRDFLAAYAALSAGEPSPLPELPIQYADFAAWQRRHFGGRALEGSLAYWKGRLGDLPPVLELPTDRPRPAVQTLRGGAATFELPASLTRELNAVSRRERVTLFMTLTAAFKALLHRYTNQTDIVVGTPIANRTHVETEQLAGFFTNTLALRTDLSGDPAFTELLGRVRETALGAYAHQDMPFEKLIEELQPERDISHNPLFQVMLVFQNAPRVALEIPGLSVESWPVHNGTAKFDLLLMMRELDGALYADVEYNADLFDASTIERFVGHFRTLLELVAADPTLRISEIPLLGDEERARLLEGWNETEAAYPSGSCLHELFEAQAARAPEATALVYGDERVSYGELNARANRLAHYLRRAGVGAETRVGVCLPRSPELVVALLGALKAGGAYVPLDPQYPRERLSFMAADAQMPLILTHSRLAEGLPETGAAVLRLDADGDLFASESEANPESGATIDNLLYVIYTSGSTGRPKGVAMPHRPLVSLLTWVGRELDLPPGAKTLQFASPSFDVSCEDIFSTLLTGGALVVVPDEVRNDIPNLHRVLAEKEIERVILTPAALQQLAESISRDGRDAPSLRRVVVSGEQLQITEAIARLFDAAEDRALRNEYGPTETHAITALTLAQPAAGWPARPSVGRPVSNARVYILDRHLQPVPVGVPGELYAGGVSLARGYLNRPGLTAERFIPSPFGAEPGARLYRTGDLARYLPDGNIEYLGRIDEQVKIRGFRVELGEIEAVLAQHPAVREVVVMAREVQPGDKRLVAYVTGDGAGAQLASDLRAYARERLPDYMTPSHFVTLDSLPLTPNGKVDRRALPAPDLSGAASDGYVAPRTGVEELVAEVWASVLGVGRVGALDNFFDAGGHSLLATQLVSRLRESLGVEVGLRQLFESPTVRGLAAAASAALGAEAGAAAPPLVKAEREGALPLSFAQQRLWFFEQLEPGTNAYNVPLAVRLSGDLDAGALARALGEVVRRHEALRTRFEAAGGEPEQVVDEGAELALEERDLRDLPHDLREAEALRLAEADARKPFDLAAGPLLRASLLRLDETEHILLFTMHHIVSDGWSMGVLLREVIALYTAFIEGEESPLPELSIQYADFAVWQRKYLTGEVLERQLAYWRERLAGAPPVLELPTDRPRPAVQTFRGAKQQVNLPPELLNKLLELGRGQGVTLYMLLLAAFQTLLMRYSGQEDVIVGSPIAGRNRAETEPLIGFFVNTLAMRTDLSGDPTFAELLGRVREVALGAYAHQDVPFEKLVEELQPERDMSHAPIFQVALTLHNVPMGETSFAGLTLSAVPVEMGTAMFDFRIWLQEWEGGLGGHVEYNTDLFDGSTIERLFGRYVRLLDAVVDDPARRLSALPLVEDDERRRLLVEWNDTATEYPREATIHELFERQVERTPDATAVVYGDERLSYAELNRRANKLGRHLRGLGVGPDTCVGLCVERSPEMVVGLLGILKAGGAYLPIDPAYPLERISYMLEEAGVPVLLTQERLLEGLPSHWAHVVCLDTDWELVEAEGEENPGPTAGAENLAYVIYTSGSTGKPKGVAVVHRNVARLVKENYFADLSPDEVFLQLASVSFDASTFEVWGSLLNGARLVLAPAHSLSLEELGRFVSEQGVTTLWLTAGLFHQMVDQRLADLRGVRQLLAGGDVLSPQHVRRVLRELPGCRVINGYGPTESTTFACTHTLTGEGDLASTVPIGRPIANTEVYLLDRRMEPVAQGVWGELHIGGDGLARGYLNRPALTAERFIPDPFSSEPGARLYRTGDVARHLEDGRIEFQGRRDLQVKVRGFRIELGEIEAVLAQHRAVREVVVEARQSKGQPDDKQLVAYLVCDADAAPPNATELRAYVRERLPDYMTPSHFVMLDALPLTPNGKVDRRALPEPEGARPELGTDYEAPRGELEEALAGVWTEVLEVERVGVRDNFFDLGGHSLLATQVISRVRDRFGVELPLRIMFEAPTVAEMCAALSGELGEGGGVRRDGAAETAAITRVERGGALPLSFAQQRLWFLDQFEPGLAVYNIPLAVRLRGRLDAAALERTLNEIVRRHESLRTSFDIAGNEPTQIIADSLELPLPLIDLSGLPEGEREAEAARLGGEEAREPFDLSRGPLLRMKLLRLAESEHVLLFTMHHIVSDNWSLNVLVGEVAALYEAFSNGRPSPLPELPIQYADYAAWQRGWLTGEALEAQLSYWRGQLRDVPVLELPTDRPRPVVPTYNGTNALFLLDPALLEALNALCRRQDVTLYMLLLAAFQTLLSRWSGQEDVVVGTAIASRNRAEVEPLIGFFVNTLALRTNLSGDPTFTELLGRVKEVALGAYAHQDVPFEKLVKELQPERDMSHAPIFQVAFALQNAPGGRLELPGLTLEAVPTDTGAAHFDLTLLLSEVAEGLSGYLEYNTDLFEADTMRRFVAHFENLLRGVAADPSRRLSELPVLSADERRRLLVEWNDTATEYPREATIHELFERQVERAPDATAVVYGDERLSYAELNRRANRLARRLRGLGVGPEVMVGICVERSAEMVVGLLGILKAGGAYVPLDPTHPAPRLAFMIEDAAVPVLLTQERTAKALPAYGGKVVRLDADWHEIEREGDENLDAPVSGEHLAYVIYTSGTTGRPKGSSVSHRAVNRLVINTDYVWLGADDRVAQVSNSSFDAATFEIWGALLNGATLVGFTKDIALSPREFAAQLHERRITTLFLTTALFNILAAEAPGAFGSLRHLLFGGEAVDPGRVREVLEGAPPARLLHVYGPTESTTYSTWHRVEHVPAGATTVPIGRAIANTEIYVLDAQTRPAPVGVAGELYIGGDGLARGYHQRPGQTAERFVPDPFSGKPGARLYRTGDVVRWRAEGHIEFLGRRDQQVKVRGFRIELGEIEAVLAQHPAVREVVVTAQGESAEKRLVAYVVGQTPAAPATVAAGHMTGAAMARVSLVNELRDYVRERLPDYMTPSHFVTLDSLPLTPNGKIDRRALPAPDLSPAVAAQDYVAPQAGVEELVAEVWASVLGVGRVGALDNFFDAGGHSLLATQLVSRLRESLGVEVGLRQLFESPTVRGLAAAASAALGAEAGVAAPPLVKAGREGALPLSFAQQRLWFFEQLEPGTNAYNVPLAVRLSGDLDAGALARALGEVVRRHEALRTRFEAAGGEPEQVIDEGAELALEERDLRDLPHDLREAEAQRLMEAEAREPFDLAAGPLLRARLLRLDETEHILLFTMHHIVSDNWSMGVLMTEVSTLYTAFVLGRPSPLPELPIQYADFAVWQREYLKGEVMERQLAYWRERLAGAPPVLELPTDRPRPAVRTLRGAVQGVQLPGGLTAELRTLSRREGVTMYMLMLAAFQTLLMRYTGQEDVVVGSPIANRNRAEVEPLIGFFVNTLAMRTDLSGDPTFAELLGRVKDVALGAYAHQDVPFEKLVEELQPERDMSHAPIFQVVFALQNAPGGELELPGLELEYLPTDIGAIRFDLTLLMHEGDEGLGGVLRYNADLFDEQTIGRMVGHLGELLKGVAADPHRRLSELPLLAAAEREQLLVEWNDTGAERERGRCVHQLFEAQAARTPDATALVFEDTRLTYAELNRRANQLAHYLRRAGVRPETIVGICMENSAEQIVALLGVLKAGGAYVGPDPSLPRERLAYMIEDARVRLILTQARLAEKLPRHEAEVILLDEEWEKISRESGLNPEPAAAPDNLAYLIYTSGSTGRPKGVAGEHRQLLHYLTGILERLEMKPGASFALHQSLAVDAPITFLYASLCTGGVLHVLRQERVADPDALGEYFRRHEIDYFKVAPSHLGALQASPRPEQVLPRHLLMVGGEASHWDWAQRMREMEAGCVILNHYGPTETTCGVLTYRVGERPVNYHSPVLPLGRPINDTRIYILDRRLRPVPVGVPGELCVGGGGVARGYLRRPGVTAEKFIPDPFGGRAGARLYRTGDLARYLPDGNIEFLGRLDHQVKIRAFRVELGEIESALGEHPSVQTAVVVAREVSPGDTRLAAYVVFKPGEAGDVDELREFVRRSLPDYMTPSAFVRLEELPRTPQGKVDRQRLPAPELSRAEARAAYVAPSTPAEREVAGIFAELLRVEEVGVNDDFFALGGHSLLATQVVSRLRETFRIEFPLRRVFETPTVGGLAAAVAEYESRPHDGAEQITALPRGDKSFEQLLAEMGDLSEEEVNALLAGEMQTDDEVG